MLYIFYYAYMYHTYVLYYDVTGGSNCSAALSNSLSGIPPPNKSANFKQVVWFLRKTWHLVYFPDYTWRLSS